MRGVVLQHWERLSRCAFRRASNQAISAFCRNPMCDLALPLGRPSWQASKGSTTKATSAAKNADQQRILTATTCIYIVDVDSGYINKKKTLKEKAMTRAPGAYASDERFRNAEPVGKPSGNFHAIQLIATDPQEKQNAKRNH